MLNAMHTCYVALKVVSSAVAVAAAVHRTEKCVATLLLDLLSESVDSLCRDGTDTPIA